MRKLYREYFYVPKKGEGIISEKVLMTRIALSILAVLLILVQMAVAAYAHFLSATETSHIYLMTANYDLDCKIKINGEVTIGRKIVATESDIYPKTYEIELTIGDENTATTGFCVVTVDFLSTVVMDEAKGGNQPEELDPQPADMIYHTQQIGADIHADGGKRTKLTFKLTLDSPATVRIIPNWGTSANYEYDNTNAELYIENGETVVPKPHIDDKTIYREIKPIKEETETSAPETSTPETSAPETTN